MPEKRGFRLQYLSPGITSVFRLKPFRCCYIEAHNYSSLIILTRYIPWVHKNSGVQSDGNVGELYQEIKVKYLTLFHLFIRFLMDLSG